MKLQIKDRYPESGVRCSEITLTVRITFDDPFVAPNEWDHDWMLKQLVGNQPLEDIGIDSYDVNCTSHIEWVDLKPVTYSLGPDQPQLTTTPDQERRYRDFCRQGSRTPTQGGFWMFVLEKDHGICITGVGATDVGPFA